MSVQIIGALKKCGNIGIDPSVCAVSVMWYVVRVMYKGCVVLLAVGFGYGNHPVV